MTLFTKEHDNMYLLDMDKLEIGDIILTSYNSTESKRIQRILGSQYSHALLYVARGSCIESFEAGVHSENIQRMLFDGTENICILRPKNKDNINEAVRQARSKIAVTYSNSEAIKVKSKRYSDNPNENDLYCTKLIAKAYEKANYPLIENSDYVSFHDLVESDKLEKISNILRKAFDEEIVFANSKNPVEKQTRITKKIYDDIRALDIKCSTVQNEEDISNLLEKFPHFDEKISKIFEDSDYYTMWNENRKKNAHYYDIKKFLELWKNYSFNMQFLYEFLALTKSSKENLIRYEQELFIYNKLNQKCNLLFFKQQINLYENLIQIILKQIDTADEVLYFIERNMKKIN